MSLLESLQLSIGYRRGNEILKDLSFSIPKSKKKIAILGPNGAGKSTFLKALVGEPVIKKGELFVAGDSESVQQWSVKKLAQTMTLIPQEHPASDVLTVKTLLKLAFFPDLGLWAGLSSEQINRLEVLSKRFGIHHLLEQPLQQLSSGERQRAFLVHALLRPTQILILDEPTSHLDPGGISGFWSVLKEVQKQSPLTLLVTTHDLAFVRSEADWIVAFKDHSLFYCGESNEFFKNRNDQELYSGSWGASHARL